MAEVRGLFYNLTIKLIVMPFVKIWIHCVWGTKKRIPFLVSEKRKKVIEHIILNAREKGIVIDTLNGYSDHLHCLISLGATQTLAEVLRLIKGEASFWINKEKLTPYKFKWAEEYYAVSVSDSGIRNVRKYIYTQEEHHRKKTWEDEQNDFILKYGFEMFSDKQTPDFSPGFLPRG